jgi:hypothetical protein
MTDSIVVFGRVCPSISQRQEAYLYGDRVVLVHKKSSIPQFDGPFRALIYAEPQKRDKGDTDAPYRRQAPLAYAGGESYEDSIRALSRRLHQLADELVREPPPL